MGLLEIILHPVASAVAIPTFTVILGAVAQKIIKNERWNRRHFIFGLELAWTTFSLSVVLLLEWARITFGGATPGLRIESYPIFAVVAAVTVGCIIFLMSEHQDYNRGFSPSWPGGTLPTVPWWWVLRLNVWGVVPLGFALFLMTGG